MANLIFRGDARPVAEVATITPANVEVGDIFTATINGRSVSYTATDTTVADVTAGITTAWNLLSAADFPEFAEITASDTTTEVTLTHDTRGVTFHEGLTATAVNGGATDDQTFTVSASPTTPADGPNVWSANNFRDASSGVNALPGVGDTVYIADSSVSILYNLDQSSAGLLTALHIEAGYEGQIGLPKTNPGTDGVTYDEYRRDQLDIKVTTLIIGAGSGNGSGRLKIHIDASVTAVTVFATGSSAETDLHALQIDGAASGCTLTVFGGQVDVAPSGGQNAEFDTITALGSAVVRCGSGTILTTVNAEGSSDVTIDSNTTTINTRDSATLRKGAGTVTTLNAFGSQTEILGAGTITNLSLGAGRTLDASRLASAVTITNAGSIGKDASINDPSGKLTWSAGYVVDGAGLHEVNHVTKQGATVTVS